MSYAYVAGTNTITVNGEANCNAQAIFTAIGTPVVTKNDEYYVIDAKVSLVNSTWKDERLAIKIAPTASGFPLMVNASSTFQMGVLRDGEPVDGCFVLLKPTSAVNGRWAGAIKLYDSILVLDSGSYIFNDGASDYNRVNIQFTGTGMYNSSETANYKDMKLDGHNGVNTQWGFCITKNFVSCEGLQSYHGTNAGILCSGNTPANTVIKLLTPKLGHNLKDIATSGGGRNFLVIEPEWDGTVNFRNFSDAHIWVAYRFRVKVVDANGNAVNDAEVELKDKHGQIVSYEDSGANLSEQLDTSETGIDTTDGSKFSVNDVIKIANEFMLVTSIAGNTLTVTRGYYTDYPALTHRYGDMNIYKVGSLSTNPSGIHSEFYVITQDGWSGSSYPQTTYNSYTLKITKGAEESEVKLTIDHRILDDVVRLPQSTASYDNIMAGITDIKTETDNLTFSGDNIQARVNNKGVLNNPPSETIADYKDKNTEEEIRTAIDNYTNKDTYKEESMKNYNAIYSIIQALVKNLSYENFRINDIEYDADDNVISVLFKIYASKDDCEDNVSPTAQFLVIATYTNNRLETYRMIKQL